jgi:ribonuclease P protein component
MLPKENRLNRSEVLAIRQKNLPIVQGNYFGLVFQPMPNESKFGVIVSTKIAKKAVLRNRLRRQLYLAIRKTFFGKPGWFLFLAKKNALDAGLTDLLKELESFKSKLP